MNVASAGPSGTFAPGGMFATTVGNGMVYAAISTIKGPQALALDQQTGQLVWTTPPMNRGKGSYTDASPILFHGMILLGTSGGESGNQPGRVEGDTKAR